MANFIVSYDLNGPNPSHKQLDELIPKLAVTYARVLETVWWLDYPGTSAELRNRLQTILRAEDRLLVCKCTDAAWQNLLVDSDALVKAWREAA